MTMRSSSRKSIFWNGLSKHNQYFYTLLLLCLHIYALKSGSAGFWGIRGSNLFGCGTLERLPLRKWHNTLEANLDAYTVAAKLGEDPSSFSKACILSSASRANFSAFFFLYLCQAACMKHAPHVFHCKE